MWGGGEAGSVSVSPAASLEDSCSVYERYMRSFHPPAAARAPHAPHHHPLQPLHPLPEEEECSGELTSLARAPPEPGSPDSPDNTSSALPEPEEEADTTRSDRSGEAPVPPPLGSLVSMENSNNAVDGGRLFRSAPVFKLPGAELTFNGTLEHLQKLKPIVDPTAAVCYGHFVADAEPTQNHNDENAPNNRCRTEDFVEEEFPSAEPEKAFLNIDQATNGSDIRLYPESESSRDIDDRLVIDEKTYSTCSSKEDKSSRLNRSGESLDISYNSGVRSPDLFSDEDEDSQLPHIRLLEFLDKHETYDKMMVKKMEKTLSGVLPPPSVTAFNLDAQEMLKKYYSYLPFFTDEPKTASEATTSATPKKLTSFVHVPYEAVLPDSSEETIQDKGDLKNVPTAFYNNNGVKDTHDNVQNALNTSDVMGPVPEMGSEEVAQQATWPDILKCRFYDVHYNLSSYSERVEYLAMRCAQRYISDEMASSVTVFSSGPQSPTSAQKRKALRLKMAQAKSPSRRLSHLARRRQAFCNAANVAERTQSTSKMVLIDKNFFPHRKLTHTNDRKSPRTRRTPGRKTPGKKTPGKKTPGKKLAGSSSKKKATRRLVMETESARSQPTRETSRRALFQSPENAKIKKTEVPKSTNARAIKSKRALFGSPETDTRSLEGTPSDSSSKRKIDMLDSSLDSGSKCKMQKSLSFGGEVLKTQTHTPLERRATEVFCNRNGAQLNELHKKKLLWAVSEALRAHGWRLGSPGFKEKATALARLTRRLMGLPPHAARLATPQTSTSDYMLRLARQYVFSIIQGRPVEECYTEEQIKLANESSRKLTGYISASAYQQLKAKPSTLTSATLVQSTVQSSRIKENTCDSVLFKSEQPKSATKNILQDKLVNIDSSSNSNSIFSVSDDMTVFKSNSMPPFKESPRKGVRRQISFDNIDVPPKR